MLNQRKNLSRGKGTTVFTLEPTGEEEERRERERRKREKEKRKEGIRYHFSPVSS